MNPCEQCIIKICCTILCVEKIIQVEDKIIERKKLDKRGGILLWDLMNELGFEGIIVTRYSFEDNRINIEVENGTVKGTTTST